MAEKTAKTEPYYDHLRVRLDPRSRYFLLRSLLIYHVYKGVLHPKQFI